MSIDIPVCQNEEDLHKTFIERSAQGFLVLRGRCIIYANSSACKIFGCKIDEMINKPIEKVIGKVWQENIDIDHFLKNGKLSPIKLHSMQREEPNVWIQARLSPINYQGADAVLISILDITGEEKAKEELLRYERELKALAEEGSRQLRDKERLATIGEAAVMIGHDLRNPLQTIVNTTYLARQKLEESLAEKKLDKPGLISDLSAIEKQSLYMNKIVCNLLDYSRPLNPNLVNLSLPNIINETLAAIKVPENIEIITQMEECITMRCDPTMIRRVLINIISNAIQAMPEGGMLHLCASATEKDVILAIKDTGPGIPLEIKNKIFRPLITTKARGMGMGLAVCKRLLEAMDGDIRIVSDKCEGTIVEIKIPQAIER